MGRVKNGLNKGEAEFTRFRTVLAPECGLELLGALEEYIAIRAHYLDRQRKEVTEAYMVALIPEPSTSNIRKFKKGMWRKTTPEGLKLKKYIEGPDGTLIHDRSYVGENAWIDDPQPSQENGEKVIDSNERMSAEEKQKLIEDLSISGSWHERLCAWKEIMEKEKLSEEVDSLNARYVVEFDMKEVEKGLHNDVVEKVIETQGTRALWIAKRWQRYCPKLPYTYFLAKLDSSGVAAVVFTDHLKRLYVTMKGGFSLEYVVDIPLDPFLFEIISSSGVEVDLLKKWQIHYYLKVLILCGWTADTLADKGVCYENFILVRSNSPASLLFLSGITGDVWDLLDELMIYMGNPMEYYERGVQVIFSTSVKGCSSVWTTPEQEKHFFHGHLQRKVGCHLFLLGAEFIDSEKSGAARIDEMFSLARRNTPAFIFVDEMMLLLEGMQERILEEGPHLRV
ncbi:hypothetical protein Patl1_20822 [Pistacia atlantica]|uniref:Uncharacterized protein n=1 Tax=Pistacia atlantica TaxID=434234 RepID=A0ACC1BKP8_9ROSI|nr:hypothetical protein Patl1_20822 [Pistacia atlantica]